MKRLRIFIVDDDKDFAESLAMVMEGRDYDVEVAYSGEEAVEKFRTQDFDLAFMDVKLPGMNGVESFLEIRKFKPEARVVMMTGYSVEQLLEQAVEKGAWGILHKPVDMDELLGMIESLKPDGILIADDDSDFVESMRDVLSAQGWNVCVVSNGRDAVDRIDTNGIDILILDLCMPVLSGLETYLELKRRGIAIPTIIVTAHADSEYEDIDKLAALSVGGILRKPFDPRDLIKAVERLSTVKKR